MCISGSSPQGVRQRAVWAVGCCTSRNAGGEWLGEVLFENRFAANLGGHASDGAVSWSRVAYGVVAIFALLTAVTAICIAITALSQ